jgi:hypothetical protein
MGWPAVIRVLEGRQDFAEGAPGRVRDVFATDFDWRGVVGAGCAYNAAARLLRDG